MARRVDPVTRYARAVVRGKVVAGRPVRLACARHLRDIEEQKKRGLVWNPEKAQRAIDFFPDMLVLENEQPFRLQPFQEFIVGSCFGFYKVDGFRRFRTAYVETGKGSGKTPLAAGIGLYGLVADGHPAAEIYAAATTQEQARIAWKDAARMVSMSTELRELITPQVASLSIPATHSVFRAVSAEHRGLDGKRVHIAIVDELHEHPTALVVDKLRAGTKGDQDALIFEITNSGWDRTSVCWQHHSYSLQVLEGLDNESWFAYVCALDEGDDWRDEKVWPKVNPGLGVTLPFTYLREQVAEAEGMPSKQSIVQRLNFCVWNEQASRAVDMDVWDQGSAPVDLAALRGANCYAGLDAGSTGDLSALSLVFGPDQDGVYDVLMRFWMPDEALGPKARQHSEEMRLKLTQWVRDGWITTTPGKVTDYDFIEAAVLEAAETFSLREIGFDRWGISQLTTHLSEKLGAARVIGVGQGFASLSAPTKELLKLVQGVKIRHGGNPVMRWMMSNLALEQDAAGNLKPDKHRSAEKIDGPAALITALSRRIIGVTSRPRWSGEVMAL